MIVSIKFFSALLSLCGSNFMSLFNVVPDEFLFDPVSKTYGDPTRRPEVKSSTIEFIAPSEYTVSFCSILKTHHVRLIYF